eukprot:CAMPEP_0183358990 /NCGR_PEP_ID=MMETSP0164_2-20130417/50930_1 /TAXON_ID=221442 /ORGANISM="Coccolithus pelagicus ssp braarudi, Strain PLY182g" /LENGTH=93 /DNA_ID=CAMNT_0025533009 /DNA_START=119 /DNA_END=397 /DNA_ORIENTATION=+
MPARMMQSTYSRELHAWRQSMAKEKHLQSLHRAGTEGVNLSMPPISSAEPSRDSREAQTRTAAPSLPFPQLNPRQIISSRGWHEPPLVLSTAW